MNHVKTLLRVIAAAMVVGGAALIAWGAMDQSEIGSSVRWGTWSAGITLIVVGASMWWSGRFFDGLQDGRFLNSMTTGTGGFGGMMQQAMATYGPSHTRADGDDLIGNAQVVAVRDTGVTIGDVNAVFEVRCLVSVAGRSPYEAVMRVALGRAQWGSFQPGMTMPVRVDADDPSKVALDPSRPVVPGAGSAQVNTVKAADIVAVGIKVSGVVQQVAPTGMTAGQLAAGLSPEEADDPVAHVIFVFSDGAGTSHRCESMFRVPDGKAHYLVPGNPIPVAFLPYDPTRATIDFSRLA